MLRWILLGALLGACAADDDDTAAEGTAPGGGTAADAGGEDSQPDEGGEGGEVPEPTEPGYQALAPLPTVLQEHAVVWLNGEIFVLGGFSPQPTGALSAYDPATDTWRQAAEFPASIHHANAAVVDGLLYVVGFNTGLSFVAVGEVHAYDPVADAWSMLGAVPEGLEVAASAVAVQGTKIYMAGGARSGAVSDFLVYDTADNSFESLPSLPDAREHTVGGFIDGVLYVSGGRNMGFSGFTPDTLAFDPAVGEWEVLAAMGVPRGGLAGAVLDGKLYTFGGEGSADDAGGVFPDAEVYDPSTDSWEALPDMPNPRHGFGAVAVDGKIYLPGGADTMALGAIDVHSVFVP